MKLVLIYGPPAAGKLTIATEVAVSTGFRVLHNHLTLDLASAIFERGTAEWKNMVVELRCDALARAATAGLPGVILTMVYGSDRVESLEGFVGAAGGDAALVHLVCEQSILESRVTAPERRTCGKIANVPHLRRAMAALNDPYATHPGRSSLVIDTGSTPPAVAAKLIVDHYALPVRTGQPR